MKTHAQMASSGRLLLLGFSTGVIVGVGELVVVFATTAIGNPPRLSTDVVWMTPLTDVIAFLFASAVLSAGGRWVRPLRREAVAASALAGLAALALLLYIRPVHVLALALLAAGIGRVSHDLVSSRPRALRLFVRVAVVALLGCLVGGALFTTLRDAPAPADTGPPPGGSGYAPGSRERPNVLLIILDTVRAKSLGLYGYERPTSRSLTQWAEGGVVFDLAIATAPWTLPSHASMFTGRQSFELTAGFDRPLDDAFPTIAEELAKHGYATAGFVANLLFASRNSGLARGFSFYDDYPTSLGQAVLSVGWGRRLAGWSWLRGRIGYHELLNRRSAASIIDRFLAWRDTTEDRPYFAFLNLYDAHEPYLPPAPFDRLWGPSRTRGHLRHVVSLTGGNEAVRPRKWAMSESDRELDLGLYEGAIAYLDRQLSRLFNALEDEGTLKETVVIVTSDHGEQFGERGLFGHTNSLYMPALHVPLAMRYPAGIPAGRRVDAPVSLRQLPATILDLLGVESIADFPGPSLVEAWTDREMAPPPPFSELRPGRVEQDWYPVAAGRLWSIVTTRFQYIRDERGEAELYKLSAGRAEGGNVAEDPENQDLLRQLSARVDSIVGSHGSPGRSR